VKQFYHRMLTAIGLHPDLHGRSAWNEVVTSGLENSHVEERVAQTVVKFDKAKLLFEIEPADAPT
jgi:hypothetical protein